MVWLLNTFPHFLSTASQIDSQITGPEANRKKPIFYCTVAALTYRSHIMATAHHWIEWISFVTCIVMNNAWTPQRRIIPIVGADVTVLIGLIHNLFGTCNSIHIWSKSNLVYCFAANNWKMSPHIFSNSPICMKSLKTKNDNLNYSFLIK